MQGMTFHGGVTETILFNGWHTNNVSGMISSVIGIILLTAIYEGLKSYRESLFARTAFLRKNQRESRNALLFSKVHFFQTFLHVIQVVLGYFIMFIFMTYNYWFCIAVGVGTVVGYWLFAWEKSNNDNTNCCL
ncbi:Copper transport protein [Camponotus japonicus]